VTLPASAITGAGAVLNGSANPNGAPTTAFFLWGTTTNYDNSTALQNMGAGAGAVAVNSPVSGLAPGTTYHFRLVAMNSIGTNSDGDTTFATPAPPAATTQPASGVTVNAAVLNGVANPGGAATTSFFQWGETTNYGNTTVAQNIGNGTSDVPVTSALSGLAAGSTYHFRLVAMSSVSTVSSGDATFLTSLPPPPVAAFTGAPISGVLPLTVTFTNLTAGLATNYTWDFGDGTFSSVIHPAKTYSNASVYTVSLNATGPGGSQLVVLTNFITVTNPPPAPLAAFSGTPTTGVAPLAVSFTNLTTGAATNYSWDFGDNTSSTAANPLKTYTNAGVFTVKLCATGPGGGTTNVQSNLIAVTNPPAPAGPGMAIQFDGVNDFVNVPDSPSLRITGPITIEAWIRRSITGVQHSIVEKYGCSGLGGYVLRVTATDKLMFGTRDDCNTGTSGIGGTSLLANTWYHVAGLWDGTQIRLYVNGVLDGLTVTSRNPKAGTTPLRIGARGNDVASPFAGLIDEVRLWNVARTVSNLQTNMNRRLAGTETNLAAYWRFDEGLDLTAADSSPNGNTGALTNGPLWVVSTAPISGTAGGGAGGGGALAAAYEDPTATAPAQLSVAIDAENNAVLVSLRAAPGSAQEIEVSSDLSNWRTLAIVPVNLDGAFEFRDELAPGHGVKFYRVRESQPVTPATVIDE
jgi:PKD repeat protein